VALTPVDRALLQRCLQKESGSWNDFVDRFLGLIYHTIHYTSHLRSSPLTPEEVEDIAQEILLEVVANDYGVLRQFRGESSLASYLTVIARRICVRALVRRAAERAAQKKLVAERVDPEDVPPSARAGLESLEEVARLLRKLPSREREVVRLFYLEGRTYEEISTELNIPVNSIGSVLARARKKLRGGDKAGNSKPAPRKSPADATSKNEPKPQA
jgi:RNA polymerase sigma-70 factor (ECF subfamily)